MGLAAAAGAGLGALGGALGNSKQKDTGIGDSLGVTDSVRAQLQNKMYSDFLTPATSLTDMGGTGVDSLAKSAVQSDPTMSGMFGAGGTMDRTNAEEKNLAEQGFNLTPEDRTAYGQASGDIARQFGEQDQNLAQSLSDRGLSNSGVAGAAFSGSAGNKMEQLAKVQQSIAKQRYDSNLQRLGQTRNFLTSLQGQNQNAENQKAGFAQAGFDNAAKRASMAQGILNGSQANQMGSAALSNSTARGSQLSDMFNSGMSGAMSGAKMGMGGGMGAAPTPTSAGSSNSDIFARTA